MLDKLSPEMRHLVILLIGGALGTIAEALPSLNLNTGIAQLAGVGVTWATLWVTKLTKQYGKK